MFVVRIRNNIRTTVLWLISASINITTARGFSFSRISEFISDVSFTTRRGVNLSQENVGTVYLL